MADGNNIGGKPVEQFFSSWSQHPLSVFIVTVLITFSFLFMLFHNNSDSHAVVITIGSYVFSLLVLGGLVYLLRTKKEVLYNSLAILNSQINERIDHLSESLEKLNVEWVQEPFIEDAEWLCPKSAKDPITDDMRQVVRNFEFLHHIEQDCGLRTPIQDNVLLKLGKFYYKEENFEKALNYLNQIKETATLPEYSKYPDRVLAAEVSLCKGQVLRKLARPEEAAKEFGLAKSVYPFAKCLSCMLYMGANDLKYNRPGLEACRSLSQQQAYRILPQQNLNGILQKGQGELLDVCCRGTKHQRSHEEG